MNVVDLFCGSGGFTKGFENAGHNVLFGVDYEKPALKTYRHNTEAEGIEEDLRDIEPDEFLAKHKYEKNDIDVVIGGSPCQGFSSASNNKSKEKNTLVDRYISYVKHFEPKISVLENVPQIKTEQHPENDHTYAEHLENELQEHGYETKVKVLEVKNYNVPQKRNRAILISSKDPKFLSYPKGNGLTTTPEEELRKIPDDADSHNEANHSERVVETLKNLDRGEGAYDFNNSTIRIYPSEPVPVPTGRDPTSGLVHYDEPRCLTNREYAVLQSYPVEYEFKGTKTEIYRQIVNSIPVNLSEAIANELIHVQKDK